jgi:hypothetical protein
LREWAEANRRRQSQQYEVTIISKDNAFGTEARSTAQVVWVRPHLFRVDLLEKGKRTHILLGTEKSIQHYRFDKRTVTVLPKRSKSAQMSWFEKLLRWPPDGPEDTLVWPTMSPAVCDLSSRWDVRLTKEDQWYLYIEVCPKRGKVAREFERRRIVLNRSNYSVRQIWTKHPNGNETTLDVPRSRETAPAVLREQILKGLPTGWKRVTPADSRRGPSNE